ncbi:ribonuclease H [Senna tora]|uniref:Ribonuclease H n=1 Tax=Senna tora TaxID=362788 RepID=A0A834WET2_9FABA|nr:ribonuclease H [Senna tora]
MFQGGYWDIEKVNKVYNGQNRSLILDTVVSRINVKMAYHNLTLDIQGPRQQRCNWHRLWQLPLPQKIIHFWWKNLNAGLPLRDNLVRRGFRIPNVCPFGCASSELEAHIFKECQFAKRVWFASRLNIRTENIDNPSMTDWICQLMNNGNPRGQDHYQDMLVLILTICWSIYMQRNEILFQQGKADDPFFKTNAPRRQIRTAGRSEGHYNHQLKLTCQWRRAPINGNKVFGIFRQHQDNLQPLCYLVTEGDQDNRLGLLRNLRNLIQTVRRGSSASFDLNISDSLIIKFMNNNSMTSISIVKTTIAWRGMSLPGL